MKCPNLPSEWSAIHLLATSSASGAGPYSIEDRRSDTDGEEGFGGRVDIVSSMTM